MMLQHLIIHFLLHYLSSDCLREVKNKGQFQTFSSGSGRGRLREVVATGGSTVIMMMMMMMMMMMINNK